MGSTENGCYPTAPISILILLLNCCFLFSSFSSCCLRHQCLLLPSAEVAVMIFALPTQHTGTFAAVCYAESIIESRKYDITLCYVKCKLRKYNNGMCILLWPHSVMTPTTCLPVLTKIMSGLSDKDLLTNLKSESRLIEK